MFTTVSKIDIFQKIKKIAATRRFDIKLLDRCFEIADKMHEGQTRQSGEPYITHPLTVALYLAQYGADQDTIYAAILHDTVEDTKITTKEIGKKFGKTVELLVEGVTKFEKGSFSKEVNMDVKIESLRKMFVYMQKDIRILIIKLFDRLHNLETLGAKNKKSALRIVNETLDVYVPLTSHFGIWRIKRQIENICFNYLHDEEVVKQTNHLYDSFYKKSDKVFQRLSKNFKKLKPNIAQYEMSLIFKSKISFHRLISKSDGLRSLQHIRTPVKILVPTIEDCYACLSYIHSLGQFQEESFHDYITRPLENRYRSIHTTIIDRAGSRIQCQIRTFEMDKQAEIGILTQCFDSAEDNNVHSDFGWMKNLQTLDEATRKESQQFWESIKNDILKSRISIIDQKGRAVFLPKNSTILDFAFTSNFSPRLMYLHRAVVNHRLVPLNEVLKGGEQVELIYHEKKQVNYRWLVWCNNDLTRNRIKKLLKKENKSVKERKGMEILQSELDHYKLGFISEVSKQQKDSSRNKFREKSFKSVLIRIAEGELAPDAVRESLFPSKYKSFRKTQQSKSALILKVTREDNPEALAFIIRTLEENKVNFIHKSTILKGSNYQDSFYLTPLRGKKTIHLSSILTQIEGIKGVESVTKRFPRLVKLSYIFIGIIMVTWAINPLVTHYLGMHDVSAAASFSLRVWGAAAFLTLVKAYQFHVRKRFIAPYKLTKLFWLLCIVTGITLYFIHYTATHSYPINATLFLAGATITTGLLKANSQKGLLSKKTKLSLNSFAFTLLVLGLSSLFFFYPSDVTNQLPLFHQANLVGLGVTAGWAAYTILTSKYLVQQKIKNRELHFMGTMFLFSAAIFSPFMPWGEITSLSPWLLLLGAANGIVNAGVAHLLFFIANQYVEHYMITALIGSIMVLNFLGESILFTFHPVSLISIAIMLTAVYLVAYFEKKNTEI